jgi:hypothetical protein
MIDKPIYIQDPIVEEAVAVLAEIPRGVMLSMPMPDDRRKFTETVRRRCFTRGLKLGSTTEGDDLILWAFDLPPRYTPTNEYTP